MTLIHKKFSETSIEEMKVGNFVYGNTVLGIRNEGYISEISHYKPDAANGVWVDDWFVTIEWRLNSEATTPDAILLYDNQETLCELSKGYYWVVEPTVAGGSKLTAVEIIEVSEDKKSAKIEFPGIEGDYRVSDSGESWVIPRSSILSRIDYARSIAKGSSYE